MAHTSHGHHIDGTEGGDATEFVIKCGGIFVCPLCTREAKAHAVPQKETHRPPPLNGNDAYAILGIISDWIDETGAFPPSLLQDLVASGYRPFNRWKE